MSYAALSARVLDDVESRLGLSSMAYKDVWEYALKSHEHEYSKVECYPQYTAEDLYKQTPAMKVITYNILYGALAEDPTLVRLSNVAEVLTRA